MQDNVIDSGDVLVIGAGLAGLFTALKLPHHRVTVVAAAPLCEGASSAWAQGGIAAAVGEGDSAEDHLADTLAAGAGLVDEPAARLLATEGPARIADLVALGVPFDREADGGFRLSREAAHSRARVVRISGDRAGAGIMAALAKAVAARRNIRILDNVLVRDLALAEGRVVGAFAVRAADGGGLLYLKAPHTVLATGGVGALFAVTTNPPQASGTGLGLAARAGALVRDAEFVQFHPTAIALGLDPAPLATEALRGEGAVLVDARGARFMRAVHPEAELAPRDIVARAIQREINAGNRVFLDCRAAIGAHMAEEFPTVTSLCRAQGLDPAVEPIPVAPAAHYHMGGVATDLFGRTSLDGLSAVGEVASTGAHGANRLASNSLLEAVVFGARVAEDIAGRAAPAERAYLPAPPPGPRPRALDPAPLRPQIERLRRVMTNGAGVLRSAESLARVAHEIADLERATRATRIPVPPVDDMLACAKLVVAGAMARRESRGAHFRLDFPQPDETARHTCITLGKAEAILEGEAREPPAAFAGSPA